MPKLPAKTSTWSRLTRQKSPPPGAYGAFWGGGPYYSDAYRLRRAPALPELVEYCKSIIWMCCNKNAVGVARVPIQLYSITKSGQAKPKWWNSPAQVKLATHHRLKSMPYAAKMVAAAESLDEITDHPLLTAIHRVNEDMDHSTLFEYTSMCMDLFGQAYWWPYIGSLKTPTEIWALPPQYVLPLLTTGAMAPTGYSFGGTTYDKHDLLLFRKRSPRNPYGVGMGPAQASVEYARLEDVFVSLQDNMLSNGPRPSLVISHKDPKGSFGPAERKRLEFDMETRGRGGRAGGVFVVDGAAAVTPISYTPMDVGGSKIAEYNLYRIASIFDIPIPLLTPESNLANMQAAKENHEREAIEPRCKRIASVLTRWTHALDPTGRRGWDRLLWAFAPAVQEDRKAEADLHKTYFGMGLPLNRILTDIGQEPVEGGDTPLVPGTLIPLRDLITQAVRDTPPKPGDVRMSQDNEDTDLEEEVEDTEAELNGEGQEDETAAKPRQTEADEDDDGEEKTMRREVIDRCDRVLSFVETEIKSALDRGISLNGDPRAANTLWAKLHAQPCHDPANGHFAACGTGGTSAGRKPRKPRKPKKPAHRRSRFHTPEHGPHVNRRLAISLAAAKAETDLARRLRGRRVGDYDAMRNKQYPSYDIHLPKKLSPSNRDEFVEVKYKSEGKKNELSIHPDALLRKADHYAENPNAGYHTVLMDVRDRSFGGSEAQHYQGHDLYYRRGTGLGYSAANMHRVADMAELKRLIAMPDSQLPETARGTMPVRTAKLEAQAAKVDASRARRDADGKKQARRAAYNARKRAGLLGTATPMQAQT